MFNLIRLISDIILIALAYVMAYLIRFGIFAPVDAFYFLFQQYSEYIIYILFIYLGAFYAVKMYKTRKGFLIEIDELVGVLFSVTLAWGVLIILTFFKGEYEYSRPMILMSWPISFALLAVSRQIILRLELWSRAKGFVSKRVAIIGTGALAKSLAERMKDNPSYGFNLVGFIGENGGEVLGHVEEISKIVAEHNIQMLYVADRSFTRQKLTDLAEFCSQEGIALGSIPDIFQILTTSPVVGDIEGLPIISLRQTPFTVLNRFIKRTFDVVGSLVGIIVFSIPMLLIVIFMKIFSPGPIIYAQARVGRRGKNFDLYKFRTMVPDAEKHTGPVLSHDDDPRKTLIGRILRRSNLDELPQLFNILKGDMTFVGPRPERPEFVNEFKQMIPKYMERHQIRPGIAGLAQFQGSYHTPAEEKIKYDLYYIENWSFLLDIKIILKCLQVAFSFKRKN